MGSSPVSQEGIASSGKETAVPVKGIGKVLVVDDNFELADMAEILLTTYGMEAMVAHSGGEDFNALASHPEIGAVVSDVVMPGMNGIDLQTKSSSCTLRSSSSLSRFRLALRFPWPGLEAHVTRQTVSDRAS